MTEGLRVEVRISGCVGGDLLELLRYLDVRMVPRHSVLTVRRHGPELGHLLEALERAHVDLDAVLTVE